MNIWEHNPNDPPWSENWQPSPEILAWFRRFLSQGKDGVWVSPTSGHMYQINHGTKTIILIRGKPNDPRHWHDKNKRVFKLLGWQVYDEADPDPDNPDHMSFAESTVASLLEDTGSPFDRRKVKLQYRPFSLNNVWQWFWVLLPEDGNAALDTGQAENRAKAGTAARLAARKLKVVIDQIEVIKPYTEK